MSLLDELTSVVVMVSDTVESRKQDRHKEGAAGENLGFRNGLNAKIIGFLCYFAHLTHPQPCQYPDLIEKILKKY